MNRPGPGVPSPCVSVCRMDAGSGLCTGCWRTLDEIAAWSVLDDDAKRSVWVQLEARRAAGGSGGPVVPTRAVDPRAPRASHAPHAPNPLPR